MNLFADIKTLVLDALAQMQSEGSLPADLDFTNVAVEPPRDPLHGDMATNAAMVLAKSAKMKPRDIADALAVKLAADDRVTVADVAGPGFLNLRLSPSVWLDVVPSALNAGTDFGRSNMGDGKKVNVEYVSANPTGPLHVGHTRGAVFGDALASLLDFAGYNVTREYYINDGGAQVDVLARSVYLRYLEANGQAVQFEDGTYPGDYLIAVGQDVKEKYGDTLVGKPESEWLKELREFSTEAMMDLIRRDLASIGVKMDVFFSEKSLYGTGRIESALADLEAKGLIYEGVLEPPKGKKPDDWEAREQTLFKSTEHGDDVDRPVKKSDGAWTYFAPDIAYHYDKVQRGFDELIDILGADHGGYVKRMKAAVSALSDGEVPLDIKLCQLVKLYKNGEPFKMSKRAGTFITLSDVVEQVGPDVARFVMLTRKNDAPLDFDFDKVLEQSKENPVFYVQNAHARVCSVIRRAKQLNIDVSDDALKSAKVDLLTHEAELTLIKKMAEWPRMLELAAKHNEPHRIAFYLIELAADFHSLYSQGNSDGELRFINENEIGKSQAKISLIRAVSVVISAGLGILGVTPMEEMR
ncbi:arginine--tRNA ligase [Amylibacter sp. SFDW26]|uniref:arginine--tRNA ligase n=1 Tax=Amylibacter sp. SFDW26 TaxID=2652722 RepID=UPI0012625C16|nr:arginine--tRNA ligase [Amylibacter sp. SFDW26]KAB7610522.1 arginine--tRNA ligase [Amylibacter sp. SFDW26]